MKWSSKEWEQQIEKLVHQCADKVILELEEMILQRLREMGQNVVHELFMDPLSPLLLAQDRNKEEEKYVWYAFGIIDLNQDVTLDWPGMEDRPCQVIAGGNLGMLVCPVLLQEYNEKSLHLHLEDMAWVESHARRHEETLLQAMEGWPVIPLPFCTIYTDRESIRRQLADNAVKILANLQRLGNHLEMHVKLLVDHNRILDRIREDLPYTAGQGGSAYFQKRQWEKRIAEEIERVMNDYGESLYQDLKSSAVELILLDKSRIIAPKGQEVVFAVQGLIAKEYRDDWDKKLERFDKIADSFGFILDVSGPWPPYHFARFVEEEETMSG